MTDQPFTIVPILDPVEARTTVDAPIPVGGEPTRAERLVRAVDHTLAIMVGKYRTPWIFEGVPPSIADLVKVRIPDWDLFEGLRHHCFDRTDGMMELAPGNWTCECTPASAEVRKAYTKRLRIINSVWAAWIVYNHVVAIPVSGVLYFAAWIIQHPGRLLLTTILLLVVAWLVFG